MSQQFKVAISNQVSVPVKLNFIDQGITRNFSFSLLCDRVPQERIDSMFKDSEETLADFMREVTRGWTGQRLILNQDDTSADFSAEALSAMLNITGVPVKLFGCYSSAAAPKKT